MQASDSTSVKQVMEMYLELRGKPVPQGFGKYIADEINEGAILEDFREGVRRATRGITGGHFTPAWFLEQAREVRRVESKRRREKSGRLTKARNRKTTTVVPKEGAFWRGYGLASRVSMILLRHKDRASMEGVWRHHVAPAIEQGRATKEVMTALFKAHLRLKDASLVERNVVSWAEASHAASAVGWEAKA